MATEVEGRPGRRGVLGSLLRVALVVVACLAAAGAIYVRNALKPRATPPPPLPVPNGYDDLVRAGDSIRGQPPNEGQLKGAKAEDLRAWVAANAEALNLDRAGLGRPSRVAVGYDADLSATMRQGSACRALSRLLFAEGELALVEDRPVDAARSFLDGVRLGQATGRGGLLLDAMIGSAIESSALDGLSRSRPGLPAAALRAAIATLLEVDAAREPFQAVLDGEAYWREQAVDYRTRLMMTISGMDRKLLGPANKSAEQAHQRTQAGLRRELVSLAERLYALEEGTDPESPADLVPAYLPAIPLDPATGRPIVGGE